MPTATAPTGLIVLFLLFAPAAFCQQNLFNMPSGEITRKGRVFYQHQLNVHERYLESKGHFVYGLGKGFEAGVNVVGKGFFFTPQWRDFYGDNPDRPSFYPFIMATTQKGFRVTDYLDLNIGFQIGANVSRRVRRNQDPAIFGFGLAVWHFAKGSRLVGGFYQSNQMFVGTGNSRGVLLGYEYKLSKRWYLMGDWISGRNDAAVAVIGGMFNVSKRIQFCSGLLVPNPNTPKPLGVVLELNLLGWDLESMVQKK